ncbi:MAG: hypothetical protein F6K42_15425 [Leptolyngbya sp. SIO1D8]|nr:hypothetical protein [Leptolyngbya sp. SIO1D8]
MTCHRTNRISSLNGLMLVLGLSLGIVGSQAWAQPLPETDATFLEWLTGTSHNQDANEPPRIKRGGSEFCFVTFDDETVTPLWRDTPTFILQGDMRSLALHREGRENPLWTYEANEAEAVTYDGTILLPGAVYVIHAQNPQFPASDFEARQFVLLSAERQVEIAFELSDLETDMRNADASAEEIALARADYFWQQGLVADAWAEVMPLKATSETVSEAINAAYERICS